MPSSYQPMSSNNVGIHMPVNAHLMTLSEKNYIESTFTPEQKATSLASGWPGKQFATTNVVPPVAPAPAPTTSTALSDTAAKSAILATRTARGGGLDTQSLLGTGEPGTKTLLGD